MGPGCKAFVKPPSHFVLFSTALKIFQNSKVLNQLQGLNGCPYFTHFVYSPLYNSNKFVPIFHFLHMSGNAQKDAL